MGLESCGYASFPSNLEKYELIVVMLVKNVSLKMLQKLKVASYVTDQKCPLFIMNSDVTLDMTLAELSWGR